MESSINLKERKSVEKIIQKYQEKEITKLDELRNLDKKAKFGAILFSYIFGIISVLILGMGMCVAMKVIFPEYMVVGIVVGVVGIFMCAINYSIYKVLLQKGIKKYSSQILELSKSLLNE